MLIEELKTQYDKVKIATIEADCKNVLDVASMNRKDFILKLYYLETTKRFKENKVYKNATFEKYIMNMFNLRYSSFNKERFAFIAHPAATAKWGAGLIDKIKTECGAGKLTEVIQAIEATPNINHAGIDKIITDFRKPRAATDTKHAEDSKRDLGQDNIKKQKQIAEYIQTVNEQTEQIDRMRKTILTLQAENAKCIQIINTLKAENTGYIQTIKDQTKQIERLKSENESLKRKSMPSFMRDVRAPQPMAQHTPDMHA